MPAVEFHMSESLKCSITKRSSMGFGVAAFGRHDDAEQWDAVQPDVRQRSRLAICLRRLSYLVLDCGTLVAAFMSRDDAEQWIEAAGHPGMELRQASKLDRVC
jgi:hypothetical protein